MEGMVFWYLLFIAGCCYFTLLLVAAAAANCACGSQKETVLGRTSLEVSLFVVSCYIV